MSRGYPTARCVACTRMVCFSAGEVCVDCIDNWTRDQEELKKREIERGRTEYRHPDQRYHGYDVLTITPPGLPAKRESQPVGHVQKDTKGRTWVRVA